MKSFHDEIVSIHIHIYISQKRIPLTVMCDVLLFLLFLLFFFDVHDGDDGDDLKKEISIALAHSLI